MRKFLLPILLITVSLTACSAPSREQAQIPNINYPIEAGLNSADKSYVLESGWYAPEQSHSWSMETAKVRLPVPLNCKSIDCAAVFRLRTLGTAEEPVVVRFSSAERDWVWSKTIESKSSSIVDVEVPFQNSRDQREIIIEVLNAISPKMMGISEDERKLGIALFQIRIKVSDNK